MNEDLKAYLDNELSPARRAEVEAALQQDPLLRAELEQLRSITESLRGYVALPQPQGYEKLATRLQKSPAGRPWWTKPLPVAASLLAVIAIGAVGTRQLLSDSDSESGMVAMETVSAPESDMGLNRAAQNPGAPRRSTAEAKPESSGQALLLVVTDVGKAEKAVEKLASSLKGSINLTKDREDDRLSLRLVVPQDKVDEARRSLGKLGSLKQSSQAELESSADVGGDSVQALQERYRQSKQRANSDASELKMLEERIAKLEAEQRAIAEGRLVEIRLAISARSKGVP